MPKMLSRIHAQLGEPPSELSFALIESAIAQQIPEADDLDWKGVLPGKEELQVEEFAKDVAAMANTSGGLLVYGVTEERGTGRAKSIQSVDGSESVQRRLRALAANRIHPAVVGLNIVPLTSDDGQTTVLVVSVPQSPDAPHIVGQNNHLGVPYRAGPETQWMRERDLERAYANRFTRRADEHARLADMVVEVSDQLDPKLAWIVAVVHPRTPRPALSSTPSRADITAVLHATLDRTTKLVPAGTADRYTPIRDLDQAALNPRVGLRRWIAQTLPSSGPDDLCHFVHVELHHDGSIGFAAALEGWYERLFTDRYHVPDTLVESFAVDLVALADAYGRHMLEQLPFAVRVDLVRTDNVKPFALIGRQGYGSASAADVSQMQGTRTIRRFIPVLGEIPVLATQADLREAARSLAEDVLHQFGLDRLALLSK